MSLTCWQYLLSCSLLLVAASQAQDSAEQEATFVCMAEALKTAVPETTVRELRDQCANQERNAIGERLVLEEQASDNRFAILPHKPNFVLPATYAPTRDEPYGDLLQGREFDNVEAKFQVSLK